MTKARQHKYGVADKGRRTYNGVAYDSLAEMLRATELDLLLRTGNIRAWAPQRWIPLGPDFGTRVDFVVRDNNGSMYAEEVKGYEPREFKVVRRLWPKYAPFPMKILKRKGTSWSVEWLAGKDGDNAD